MSIGTNGAVFKTICGVLAFGACTSAHAVPWVQYSDIASDSFCDLVNAANLDLVVLEATGQLVGVSETDVVFLDTFVDETGLVFYQGHPAGVIVFADDGDGFRTLWWITMFGDVANVNEFTGEPTPTGLCPDDFVDVPCDACPFWDRPAECVDSDSDGVEDVFDLCGFTPFDEAADGDGCSCSQLDDDVDGVDNCIDLCPETPLDLIAEADGCAIQGPPGGEIVISICGSVNTMVLAVMLCGLVGLRLRLCRRDS